MASPQKTVLFVQEPAAESQVMASARFADHYTPLYYTLSDKEAFLAFLQGEERRGTNIVAIYGGFAAFAWIGGLTADIIGGAGFPLATLRCIVLCSRGYNGFDLECLRKHGIALYNYQDAIADAALPAFQVDQVSNDVADCALWHVLEGFRKFSYQQEVLRGDGNTLRARARIAGYDDLSRFAFGHEVAPADAPAGHYAESPRGKRCLVLGLGSIGTQVALKLQHGLGMEVHYAKRTPLEPALQARYGWPFHPLDATLLEGGVLQQFHAIVVALPLTPETHHLVDARFLAQCRGPELVLVNVGRGTIVDSGAAEAALRAGRLRHLGTDVFHDEPVVDAVLREDTRGTTCTPHDGSATIELFTQSCELALMNILRATEGQGEAEEPGARLCRVA